jgi:hypothetical protein
MQNSSVKNSDWHCSGWVALILIRSVCYLGKGCAEISSGGLRVMTRRGWLQAIGLGMGRAMAVFVSCQAAIAQQVPGLSETLRSVLKCRKPEEFAFVEVVVAKVNQGLLPLEMVLSMMKWARERREDIPFPYFQEGIRKRAAAIGVTL